MNFQMHQKKESEKNINFFKCRFCVHSNTVVKPVSCRGWVLKELQFLCRTKKTLDLLLDGIKMVLPFVHFFSSCAILCTVSLISDFRARFYNLGLLSLLQNLLIISRKTFLQLWLSLQSVL